MNDARVYWKGVALTALGVIVISPDAMLYKQLTSDFWTTAFWRLLLLGAVVSLYLIVTHRGAVLRKVRDIGRIGIAAAVALTFSNLGFLYGLTHTTVADTLAIIAAAPIFTAFFEMAIGHRPPLRTWLAAIAVAVGIAVIFDAGFTLDNWKGNLGALVSSISISLYFTLGRARRQADMTPALAMSAFLTAGVAAVASSTLMPAAGDWPILLFLGLFILPVSLGLITAGPRRIPATEVGLLLLLEPALGPIWAWVFIDEVPGDQTLVGGALILGAIMLHGLAGLAQRRTAR